jgi:hypothetical protein
MSGPDDLEDLDPRDAERLNDLVRRARTAADDRPEFDRRLLLAYLRGHTSTEDAARVQDALADSVELRREFLYMAGLHDRDIQARFDAAIVPAAPVEARAGIPVGARTERPAAGWSAGAPAPSAGRRRFGTAGWLGLAAAAAVVAALILVRPDDRRAPWRAEGALTHDQLEPDRRRGPDDPLPPAPTPRVAAIRALAALLDTTAATPPVFSVPPGAPSETRRIVLADRTYDAVVPAGVPTVALWHLDRPGLILQQADLSDPSVHPARLVLDREDRLVVTYPVPGGFGSSPVSVATDRDAPRR